MTFSDWMNSARTALQKAGIPSPRLDAEIILAHTVKKSRTYLHAHGDEILPARLHEIADARLALREDRTPVAYIIGHKEFYGRLFKVTTATLIPRPESEAIIHHLIELSVNKPNGQLIDVGTGSGCLGITAKLELPMLRVTLSDISQHALNVALSNAKYLNADITTIRQNLLSEYFTPVDYIIANLPYVSRDWERSPEIQHEPNLALFAENHGLSLIFKLLPDASRLLLNDGYLFLEADPRQHSDIIKQASAYHLTHVLTDNFIVVLQKRIS